MKLSKTEKKYRTKFIQEHHYDKFEQSVFDNAKSDLGATYKEIYKGYRKGQAFWFMYVIGVRRTGKAMHQLSLSAIQACNAFTSFVNAWKESGVF